MSQPNLKPFQIDLLGKRSESDESLDQGEDDEKVSLSETEDHVAGNEQHSGDAVEEDDVEANLSPGEIVDGPQEDSSDDLKMTAEVVPCQSEDVQRVETSAIMGVGLQELLSLIDEKLSTQRSLVKRSFDCKWRPPYSSDAEVAVEH